MEKRIKIISVVGARPNFIKIAPLCLEMGKFKDRIENILVHTGQHYNYKMSGEFFKSLAMPKPDINLESGSASHGQQTAEIMNKFEPVCLSQRPDWVIVVGDVNSTLACALVAKKLNINLAHIEAGLRSFDMTMPEEINRKVTDGIADLLFTHSADADDNLKREGVDERKIKMVGNIMIDTLVNELDNADMRRTYEKWNLKQKHFVYTTLHRPSNVDEPEALSAVIDNLVKLAERIPVVFAIHPRTLKRIADFGFMGKLDGAHGLIASTPVSYHDSICLEKNALFVLTDSGGIQEETTFLGTPCLTLRSTTERPVTIIHGTNKLTSMKHLWKDIDFLLAGGGAGNVTKVPRFWDGQTSKRIVETLLTLY